MGSPKTEEGHRSSEEPQHEVKVHSFFMGKYPVTQAQWRVVAVMPQVNRKLDPAPARFKGDRRPVEQVSWDQAVEFCQRISRHTGREYRLPTEAEWEYACRAGTATPFHFGDTLTSDLANYAANRTYGKGPRGEYRGQTTDLGSFPANSFGLYDMHGNVLEWCLDRWHGNYESAPNDGTAWIVGGDDAYRLLRGGSWGNVPALCRTAYRFRYTRTNFGSYVGFRVVCAFSRTL
jgi:formylglycine-generating enzyme required for sulfatase activity